MRSVLQIAIGILILGAAFIFGQHVHREQMAARDSQESLEDQADTFAQDTSWQNRTGRSLFDLSAPQPGTPQSGTSQPGRSQGLVPFPNPGSPGQSTQTRNPFAGIQGSGRAGTMPNHLSGLPVESGLENRASEPSIFTPLAGGSADPANNLQAPPVPALKPAGVPLIEPDFSGIGEQLGQSTGDRLLIRPLAPRQQPGVGAQPGPGAIAQHGPGADAQRGQIAQPGTSVQGGAQVRPTAPEFTIYPNADRNTNGFRAPSADAGPAANSGPPAAVAQTAPETNHEYPIPQSVLNQPGQGISPVSDPLVQPTLPGRSESVLQNEGLAGSAPAEESWIDAFNEPLIDHGNSDYIDPGSSRKTERQTAARPPRDQATLPPVDQSSIAQTNLHQTEIAPTQITPNQPRVNQNEMLPFGLNERAKSELVKVAARQTEFKLSTNQFVDHRTEQGDSLQKLATEYLGSPEYYLDIYLANQDQLRNPADVPTGITLRIPVYK